jgi:coenzyme F420 hydrogenase subunit beta
MVLQDTAGLYTPVINVESCTGCGLCLAVCPTIEIGTKPINRELPLGGVDQCELDFWVFGHARSNSLADVLLGIHKQSYVGHSVDAELRWQASSGGLVSTLLIYALAGGLIDGALVTGVNSETGLPGPIIARTPEAILQAMGSKYCVTPNNEALRIILREKGRYAVVGLPCQLHGLRLAQRQNKKLQERIIYTFSLFCSGTMGAQGTMLLRKSLRLDKVEPVHYRGGGWPGGFQAVQSPEHYIPFSHYLTLLRTYTPPFCLICWDAAGEFADLSFGDAWLPELIDEDVQGTSMLIARTDKGQALLDEALTHQQIVLREISDNDVLRARGAWKIKKQYREFKLILSRLWYPVPPDFKQVYNYPNAELLPMLRIVFWFTRCFLATQVLTRGLVAQIVIHIARRLSKSIEYREKFHAKL